MAHADVVKLLDEEQIVAIDAEIERKYRGSLRSSIDAMLSDAAVGCTFRVDPAPRLRA